MPLLPLVALLVFFVLWTRETLYKPEATPSPRSDSSQTQPSQDIEAILKDYLLKQYLSKGQAPKS
ncbi:MAG: hypothetical protein AAF921_00575 [Cyanobacteria bacterium P01_D01_bin.44]